MSNEIKVQDFFKNENSIIEGLTHSQIKGVKTPLALKIIDVSKTLPTMSEEEYQQCFLQMVSDASRIQNAGLDLNDHDLIYPIKRGKKICLQMHYLAPFRVAKRLGYNIIPSFYPVFQGDVFNYKERRDDNNIVRYDINHQQINPFVSVNGESLVCGQIQGFCLRLIVSKLDEKGQDVPITETITFMSSDEVISRSIRGDNAIFKSEYKKVDTKWGKKDYKINLLEELTKKEINTSSIWYSDTKAMCFKTLSREAFRPLKESLPGLDGVFKIIDAEDRNETSFSSQEEESQIIDVSDYDKNIDLKNLPEHIKQKAVELHEIYMQNPSLAKKNFEEIRDMFKNVKQETRKEDIQKIINEKSHIISALSVNEEAKKTFDKWIGE